MTPAERDRLWRQINSASPAVRNRLVRALRAERTAERRKGRWKQGATPTAARPANLKAAQRAMCAERPREKLPKIGEFATGARQRTRTQAAARAPAAFMVPISSEESPKRGLHWDAHGPAPNAGPRRPSREALERRLAGALRDRAAFEFLYGTGCRPSELINLDLGDLQFDDREAMLRNAKNHRDRVVIYGRPARDALREWIRDGRPRLAGPGEKAVFLNMRGGGRLSKTGLRQIVHGAARGIGLTGPAFPYRVRHSFASHMLDRGANLRVIQEQLGHVDLGQTSRYTHVTAARLVAVLRKHHPRG